MKKDEKIKKQIAKKKMNSLRMIINMKKQVI
jgi:hypothetical protein